MQKVMVGAIMVGRPFFDIEHATKQYGAVLEGLKGMGIQIVQAEKYVTNAVEAAAAAAELNKQDVEAVVIVQGTFADASVILSLASHIDVPLLLWAVKEQATGARLRLNSFCGLNLAAHALGQVGKNFKAVYGDPSDPKAQRKASAFLNACGAIQWLKGKRIGVIGNRPLGYYPSNFNELALYEKFGIIVEYIPLSRIFQTATALETGEHEALLQGLAGIENVDKEGVDKSLKAYQALRKIIAENALNAVAVECWPEFMAGFGGAACFALGQLNDDGIDAACEADVIAALTMLLGRYFSGVTTFVADLVAGDDNSNELLFWHCGNGPRSLAASGCTPVCGVHPNRKVPLGLHFPLRGGDVTVARLSPDSANRMRLLSVAGTAAEAPLAFSGNSLPVKTKAQTEQIIDTILEKGFEHHYIVMYGDYALELADFADLLQLELINM